MTDLGWALTAERLKKNKKHLAKILIHFKPKPTQIPSGAKPAVDTFDTLA